MIKRITARVKEKCKDHKWESVKAYDEVAHYYRCSKCGHIKKTTIEK